MMTHNFYCDEVLSGKTPVQKVMETDHVLAYHHTKPSYPVHIVAFPKKHIDSFIALGDKDNDLLLELFKVIRQVAEQVTEKHGSCRVITNLGDYQDSKHLHFHIVHGNAIK
ncbi:HIT domain-containing protein [Melghiribacillus thermohalophilus]|nr:HIT domain-containing protein [Melghiribacillus thermohalophilus]